MLSENTIRDLKTKHGDNLAAIDCGDVVLVFRGPTRDEFDRWFDRSSNERTSAARELAQSCVVYPGLDDMRACLDRSPGLLMRKGGILDVVTDLAGFDDQRDKVKKL